jgi:hypothetical protein
MNTVERYLEIVQNILNVISERHWIDYLIYDIVNIF